MSYLVLARKYRPQSFADMIGQGHVVRTLTNAIRQDRVAHAFLFTGARGVGKTSSARLLAKALNCENGPTPEPCGACTACTEIAAGNSVDVQEIDGASNNGVDQVRELRENARYLPSRDRHKIYIIDEVHMLSGAAFNALLKTLEEPPDHVKFIFATTEPHKIPVTILSRTQRFDFRRIPLNQIVGRIETILESEGLAMSPRAVALVARQAEGSMRDGLSLLDQVVSAGGAKIDDATVEEVLGVIDRTEVAALAGALIEGDGALALEIAGRVFDRGLDLARLAEDLAWHLRNLMVVQVGGRADAALDVADHEREGLQAQAAQASPATLAFLFDVVHGAAGEIGRAIQPRLALEVALLKAIHMAPGVDLAGLVERVEALAAGAPLPPGGGRGRTAPPSSRRPAPAARQPARSSPPAGRQDAASPSAAPSASASARAPAAPSASAPVAPAASAAPPPAAAAPPPALGGKVGEGLAARAAKMQALAAQKTEPESAPAVALVPEPPDPDEPPPPGDDDAPPGGGPEARNGAPRPASTGNDAAPAKARAAPASPATSRSEAARGRGAASRSGGTQNPGPTGKSGAPAGQSGPPADAAESPAAEPEGAVRLPKADVPDAPLADRYAALAKAVTEHAGRPFLAAALEHARPVSIDDEELVVALPRGLYYDGLGGPANRRSLEQLLEDHFGRPLRLRIDVADEKRLADLPESIAAQKERRLAEEVEALRAEALSNPAVRLTVEALDGEIEAIRILKPED